jgi:hypothetical protein
LTPNGSKRLGHLEKLIEWRMYHYNTTNSLKYKKRRIRRQRIVPTRRVRRDKKRRIRRDE